MRWTCLFQFEVVVLTLQIHPSSALKYTDITPEFIVYECSVRTSNDFILNVCAADSSWLNEINQNVLEEGRKVCSLIEYTYAHFLYQVKHMKLENKMHVFYCSCQKVVYIENFMLSL